jgi:hypothetical protein
MAMVCTRGPEPGGKLWGGAHEAIMFARSTCAAVALLCSCVATPAFACGGFFCFTQPVDQSAERILYLQQGGKITVHIQISYTGDDDKFSWVLPLQKQPTLGIGSDTVFQMLEQYTAPVFQLAWQNKTDCYGGGPCEFDSQAGGPPNADGTKGGGVTVLAQENIGPYATTVLKGDTAAAVVKWLNDNGYVQPKETVPLIDVYVKQQFVFLALKLQKDKGAGDLAPIVVTLDETSPCLPIRLTQLAAKPDMPIVAWLLGGARAIPKNFLHVELNEATVDWLTGGGNYKTVVSKAVDQASGHAFLTEHAEPTAKVPVPFAQPGWNTGELAQQATPGKFMQYMLQHQFPRSTQMQALIRKHVPKPKQYEKVTDQEFYNCIQCEGCNQAPCSDYQAAVAQQKFDPAAFAKDVQDLVVKPLQDVDAGWKAAKWMTRLYTTVDPNEMTKDPIFAWNPDLPAVLRVKTAKAEPICVGTDKQAKSVRLTFADGSTLEVPVPKDPGPCWGLGGTIGFGKGTGPINDAGGQPAGKVQVLDESGAPFDVHPDDADKVDAELNKAKAGTASLSAEFKKGLKSAASWNPKKPGGTGPASDTGSGADTGSVADAGSSDTTTTPDATTASETTAKPPATSTPKSGGICSAARVGAGTGWAAALLLVLAFVGVRRRLAD